MVFRNRDKRKRKGQTPPSRAGLSSARIVLTDLPDEILLKIIKDCDIYQILQCRLVHPRLTAVANEILSHRLRCLYLHPSRRALHTALQICDHPVFGEKIDELVVLGGNQAVEDLDSIQLLLAKLSKMNVSKLAYAKSAYKSGFSSVPLRKHLQKKPPVPSKTGYVEAHLMKFLNGWWDKSEVKLREMSFQAPLPHHTLRPCQHVCALLTHLDLALDASFHDDSDRYGGPSDGLWLSSWQESCRNLLFHTDHLKSLTLSVDGVSRSKHIAVQAFLPVLFSQKKHWPYLRALKIHLRPEKDFWTTRIQRPACMAFNNPAEETVEFDNVLFPSLGWPGGRKAILTTLDIVSHLSNIENFTWKINRFEHHQWCKRKTHLDDFDRCSHSCGVYDTRTGGGESLLRHFAGYAESLGLELEEGRFWDFAKARGHIVDEAS